MYGHYRIQYNPNREAVFIWSLLQGLHTYNLYIHMEGRRSKTAHRNVFESHIIPRIWVPHIPFGLDIILPAFFINVTQVLNLHSGQVVATCANDDAKPWVPLKIKPGFKNRWRHLVGVCVPLLPPTRYTDEWSWALTQVNDRLNTAQNDVGVGRVCEIRHIISHHSAVEPLSANGFAGARIGHTGNTTSK